MTLPIRHLYLHIPFCPSKCPYCAFVTHIGSSKLIEPYVQALAAELALLARERPGGPLDTVYFGGGTPSMLDPRQIETLLARIRTCFGLAPQAEVTLEAHPATLSRQQVPAFAAAGITRLSMGGESLVPGELQALGREYDASHVAGLVEEARSAGMRSVNLDLIYGLPGQSHASWIETLESALAIQPDHLSLYPLSIEPKTVYARRQREQALILPSDEAVVDMYRMACDRLRRQQFEHYEVANWARPGHRSQHNLAYWWNREYYGAGVGAHSYLHPERRTNLAGTKRYIETLTAGRSPVVEREPIDAHTRRNERIMLRLRLLEDGLDLASIDPLLPARRTDTLRALQAAGLIRTDGTHLWLRETAVPVANEIWSRLLDD